MCIRKNHITHTNKQNVVALFVVGVYKRHSGLNSSPPGQNGRHFVDDVSKCICTNEKFCILNRLSLKLVPKGLINNIPALVEVMAWCRSGDKLLSESMLTYFTDALMRH